MTESPFDYQPIAQSTWAYLSSLLMLALFFKFSRFWSVRNFDLILIILLAPGILLVDYGLRLEKSAVVSPGMADVDAQLSPSATPEDAAVAISGMESFFNLALTGLEEYGQQVQRFGYIWLFSIGSVIMLRML